MSSVEQQWFNRQEECDRSYGRGFEDGLAGIPPEQKDRDYHDGFVEGGEEGLRSNRIIAFDSLM
jgi:hypothetical protein